jgi:hypothetical protein
MSQASAPNRKRVLFGAAFKRPYGNPSAAPIAMASPRTLQSAHLFSIFDQQFVFMAGQK